MMKKIGIIVLDLCMVLSMFFMGISFSIKDMIVETITDQTTGDVIAEKMMDVVSSYLPDVNYEHLLTIQNTIANSSPIQSITSKYIDALCNFILNSNINNESDVQEDIQALANESLDTIEKNINYKIPNQTKVKLEKMLVIKMNHIYKMLQSYSYSYIENIKSVDEVNTFIRMYQGINSISFKVICGIVSLVSMIGILVLKKSVSQGLKNIGCMIVVTSLCLFLITPIIIQKLGTYLLNMVLGMPLLIQCSKMKNIGYLFGIIGIITIGISFVCKKIDQKIV